MNIAGEQITRGLIIRSPWIEYILSGEKTWEMRSTGTTFRGRFALIQQGTGVIVGLANLMQVLPKMTLQQLVDSQPFHRVDYQNHPEFCRWNRPWVFDAIQPVKPIRYQHPQGAVIWVKLVIN